jgi:hypothetical protein
MKKRFLLVYDYGQGGVWLFIHARSADEIRAKYPELQVIERHPEWLKGDYLKRVESERTFDIDKPPSGWLLSLVERRPIEPRLPS